MELGGNPNVFHLKNGKVIFTGKKFDLYGKYKEEYKTMSMTLYPDLMKKVLEEYFTVLVFANETKVKIQQAQVKGEDLEENYKNCPNWKEFKLKDSGTYQFSYIVNLYEKKPYMWLKMIRFEFPDKYHIYSNGVLFSHEEDITELTKFVNQCIEKIK